MTCTRPRRWGVWRAGGLISIAFVTALPASCGPSGTRQAIVSVAGQNGQAGQGGQGDPDGRGGAGGQIAGSGGAGGVAGVAGGGTGGTPSQPMDAGVDLPPPPDTAPPVDMAPPPPPDMAPPPPDLAPDLPPDVAPDTAPALNLNAGLVSRWKMDDGSGNTVDDSVGNNDGTYSGGAKWQGSGFPGAKYPNPSSLRFDGVDDFVELGRAGIPANRMPISVAFWLNYGSVPSGNEVAVSLTGANTNPSRLKMGFRQSTLQAWNAAGTLVNFTPPANGWHHFVYTFDGTRNRLYVDGQQRATTTTQPDSGAIVNARVGAIYNGQESFDGIVDELRIYNRAISALEVAALYDGQQ